MSNEARKRLEHLECEVCIDLADQVYEAGAGAWDKTGFRIGGSPGAGTHVLMHGPSTGAPIAVCDVLTCKAALAAAIADTVH
jgi:hypothetical protein